MYLYNSIKLEIDDSNTYVLNGWFCYTYLCNRVPKLIFYKNYILLIMLLQLSCFPPLSPFTQQPPLPQAIPPPLFMSMGHAYKFFGYYISYTVLYIPWLFYNYLFVLLNPLPCLPYPPQTPLIWLSVSMILSLFFLFA